MNMGDLDERLENGLTCSKATGLLLPHFDILESEKIPLGTRALWFAYGVELIVGVAIKMTQEYFKYDFREMINHPQEWNEERKLFKQEREGSLQKERENEQRFFESQLETRERLVSLGLDSPEQRLLYSTLEYFGSRLDESVRIAKYLDRPNEIITENTRPDLLPVYSRILKLDAKEHPLEIELDKENFRTLMTAQLYYSVLIHDSDNVTDKVGLYWDNNSFLKRIDPDFCQKATGVLMDEIYRRTDNGEEIGFLDSLLVKRSEDNFYLIRGRE